MKMTLNPVLRSLSGRIGGMVFYQSHGRQFARAYVVPRNPDTVEQRKGRGRFAGAVKAWQNLPALQKDLWRVKAKS